MPHEVRERLGELGAWLDVCGEGIYSSDRDDDAPRFDGAGQWFMTRVGDRRYAFGLGDGQPGTVRVDAAVASARVLGGDEVRVETDGGGFDPAPARLPHRRGHRPGVPPWLRTGPRTSW